MATISGSWQPRTDRVLSRAWPTRSRSGSRRRSSTASYPPGTHLQQDELCARFGVSRTPVREALRKLQATNLVDLVPNRGATVRIPTRKELVDVYALRAELEGYACQLARAATSGPSLPRRAGPWSRPTWSTPPTELEHDGLQPEDEAAFNARVTLANVRFHGAIHRLADNARLGRTIEELQSYFPKDYVWRALRDSPEGHVLSIDEHEQIRDALARARRARRPAGHDRSHRARRPAADRLPGPPQLLGALGALLRPPSRRTTGWSTRHRSPPASARAACRRRRRSRSRSGTSATGWSAPGRRRALTSRRPRAGRSAASSAHSWSENVIG